MSEIKKGVVVVLKSGGPDMTVADVGDYSPIHSDNAAKCVWFDKNKKHEEIFDVELLKIPARGFVTAM